MILQTRRETDLPRLSKATLVDTFSTQDLLVSLVENMKRVVMIGLYRQYLLVCLLRVMANRQDKSK